MSYVMIKLYTAVGRWRREKTPWRSLSKRGKERKNEMSALRK